MNFTLFVILVVLGLVCFQSHSLLSKIIGVVLFIVAFNPLSISLTKNDIPTNIKLMWHAGETGYEKTLKTAKNVRDTVSKTADKVEKTMDKVKGK